MVRVTLSTMLTNIQNRHPMPAQPLPPPPPNTIIPNSSLARSSHQKAFRSKLATTVSATLNTTLTSNQNSHPRPTV